MNRYEQYEQIGQNLYKQTPVDMSKQQLVEVLKENT